MRVAILGPLETGAGEVGGGRLRALLARLALDAGRVVSSAALVDAVWDDEQPAAELHALQSLVSRLRRSLGDGALVEQAAGGYRLVVEPDDVDALRFERLAAEGSAALHAGEHERAAVVLREALALWRGPALTGIAEERRFAAAAAARLEDLRLTAIADRIAADLGRGRAAGLVSELDALVGEHPLHERLAAQRVGALHAAGRQSDALAAYERIRARRDDELGVAPSRWLLDAHLAVVRGDEAAARAPGPPRRARRPLAARALRPRRAALPDARDAARVRHREARRGGRPRARAHRPRPLVRRARRRCRRAPARA